MRVFVRPNRRPLRPPTLRAAGFPVAVWMQDRSAGSAPDPDDPLRRLALGVLRVAAADLRQPGDPLGIRSWLTGEDGAAWLVAALGDAATDRIRARADDPQAWAGIVRRAQRPGEGSC